MTPVCNVRLALEIVECATLFVRVNGPPIHSLPMILYFMIL